MTGRDEKKRRGDALHLTFDLLSPGFAAGFSSP